MSEELAVLARAFATHLEHLREFRGLGYVGASPVPRSDSAEPVATRAEPVATRAEPVATRAEPVATRAAQVDAKPAARPEPPRATERNPPGPESTYSDPQRAQSQAPQHQQMRAPAPASAPAQNPTPPPTAAPRTQAGQWPAAKKLAYLRERNVGDCRRCQLSQTRKNIVFGVGNPEADLMIIGEAPGADEDRLGDPFVGAAGRRLDQWLHQLGLAREQVYIANVIKCRPPRNRDPWPVEIDRCSPFLHAQIRAIEPRVIVALGRFAGCLLLGREQKMYEMRGAVHRYREPKTQAELPLVVTYHPSYVLRRDREVQAGRGRPDHGGAIKSEDQKVLDDLGRAVSLIRSR